MPLTLSLFLTLSAAIWFFYGLFIKDFYIAAPNVVGFLFGMAQIILYLIYKDKKQQNIVPENKLRDISTDGDRNSRDHMQNSSTVEIADVINHNHGQAHRGTN
ncbi:bidirectional sugar transporter NEC1-like [Olea europaea subsp. europaea]|uniref:Bidirectional sugar transporter NEC1-like n=1 Tax=Olea europaea subsp. europaea TaxID=158383 RepID=A0A8S0VJU1_OLEEU|nr:bidirectional sugar transporter NEC1-like [Olea europaea subsp. europaea]